MTGHWRCSNGHQWQQAASQADGALDQSSCPECGSPSVFQAGEDLPPIPPAVPLPPLPSQQEPTGEFAFVATSPAMPQVPGYEVLEVLGRGGMGVVYKARQVGLDRLVALKMILAGAHASPEELARFRIEAEAVSRLQHVNIVQIYQIGQWQPRDGSPPLPFFSLEYVPGGTLARKIDGTPQPAREAAGLVEVLARAMEAAHQRGIVHRDLKPGNILLSFVTGHSSLAENEGKMTKDQGPRTIPKIADFGLAKKLDAGEGRTRSGVIMGTPSYMAPEQAAGKSKDIGPLADVYALGAILYELLTGRPPFRGETPLDTLRQVVSEEPLPPSRLNSRIPRDLETICLKCVQKEPSKRYASARALAHDLRRFQAGEPILARPISRWQRAWKWVKRRPAIAGLVAGVVLLLLGGSGVALSLAFVANTRAREVLQQTKRADENARIVIEQAEAALAVAKAQLKLVKEHPSPRQAKISRLKAVIETREKQIVSEERVFQLLFEKARLNMGSLEEPFFSLKSLTSIELTQLSNWAELEQLHLQSPSLARKEAEAKVAIAQARLDQARLSANYLADSSVTESPAPFRIAEAKAALQLAEIHIEKVKNLVAQGRVQIMRTKKTIDLLEKRIVQAKQVKKMCEALATIEPNARISVEKLRAGLSELEGNFQRQFFTLSELKVEHDNFLEETRHAEAEFTAARDRLKQVQQGSDSQ